MSEKFAPTRRNLVVGAAMIAAAAPANAAARAATTPFHHHDVDDWRKQIGQMFAVADENGARPMRLAEVKAVRRLRGQRAAIRDHGFAAIFEMDATSAPAGSKTYAVRHPGGAVTPIHLVRTRTEGGKAYLRAGFN